MLDALSVLAGSALLLFVVVDVFMTVLMLGGGAGPQSGHLAERAWRLALRLHDSASERSHSLMRAAGPTIVLLVLAVWVLELVVGWALVFVPAAFSAPAEIGPGDRFVFAGMTVVGRAGNSPALEVGAQGWELLHWLAGVSGVLIVSVGIAYVLPILGAVAHKRSIAATIATLGDSLEDMRALGRTPNGSSFELHLVGLVPAITLSAERHRSYPVLHYFHSHDYHAALAPAVARLVLLLRGELGTVDKVDRTVTVPLERAVTDLLAALGRMGLARYASDHDEVDDAAREPITLLSKSGVATNPPALPWLEAYVRYDGWRWEDVVSKEG